MTCCAAAICAEGRHSVSSHLPVLGCSALPRHCVPCLGPQSCDRRRKSARKITNFHIFETRRVCARSLFALCSLQLLLALASVCVRAQSSVCSLSRAALPAASAHTRHIHTVLRQGPHRVGIHYNIRLRGPIKLLTNLVRCLPPASSG